MVEVLPHSVRGLQVVKSWGFEDIKACDFVESIIKCVFYTVYSIKLGYPVISLAA